MNITMIALGSRGDIFPYATLGKALVEAGHQVHFMTTEDYSSLVFKNSLGFLPIKGSGETAVHEAGINVNKLMLVFARLSKGIIQNFDTYASTLEKTDLIINQLPVGVYGYDLSEKYQVPTLMAGVIPLTKTSAFPAMGMPVWLGSIPGFNRFSYSLVEQLTWIVMGKDINRWRTQDLGLPPTPLWGYFDAIGTHRMPVLNGFSPHVVPPPPDWDKNHIHTTGYWFPEEKDWAPPDALLHFLESGAPPVFIGFGSMPVKSPRMVTEQIIQAVSHSGSRAILHAGWAGLGAENLPDYIFPIDYAPYGWLFSRMSAIIHHGGSGTTAFGLRSGRPSMIIPFLFDQYYWGKQIASRGVGPAPQPFKRLSPIKLGDAIRRMQTDTEMQSRAAALGEKIRVENGLAQAVEVVEKYL